MSRYLTNIYDTVNTLWTGMQITFRHMMNIRRDNVTLQYPEERWPRPERNIGFNHEDYNVIRSRLHVDIDDCIGCYRCERACPVDCIKIETIKFLINTNVVIHEKQDETQKNNFIKKKKISRNEPCSCGSGKKYKHCHGKVA